MVSEEERDRDDAEDLQNAKNAKKMIWESQIDEIKEHGLQLLSCTNNGRDLCKLPKLFVSDSPRFLTA